jgi:hypothetical protein
MKNKESLKHKQNKQLQETEEREAKKAEQEAAILTEEETFKKHVTNHLFH